jgi:hypothetical protein
MTTCLIGVLMTSNDLEWLTRWTALMIFLIRLLAAHALLAATQNGADL